MGVSISNKKRDTLTASLKYNLFIFNARASNAMPLHPRFTQNFLIKEKENSLRKTTLTFANKSYFNINKFYYYKNYGERNTFVFSSFSFNEILLNILFN